MINLIPAQLKKERRLKSVVKSLFLAVVVFITVLAIVSEYLSYQARIFQNQLSITENKIADANESAKQYSDIEQKIDQVNQKLAKIEKVNKTRPLWSVVINEFEKTVPLQASISSLSLDQVNSSLTLSGQAESRREIAKFKEKMESSPYFKDVYFSSSAYQSGQNNFTFSITANLERAK